MDFDDSTDALLRQHAGSADNGSTDALLNEGIITASTSALVDESVTKLIGKMGKEGDPTTMGLQWPDVLPPLIAKEEDADFRTPEYIPRESSEGGIQHNPRIKQELQRLYVRIKAFLSYSGLSMDFLSLFQHYMILLQENDLDPLQDIYFQTLKEELGTGLALNANLEDVLECFLISPRNAYTMLVLYEHNKRKSNLQKYFKIIMLKFKLQSNLERLEIIYYDHLRHKYLIRWKRKYGKCAQEMLHAAETCSNFRLISFAYDKWSERVRSNSYKEKLADYYFMNKMFHKIIKKPQRLKEMLKRSIQLEKKLVLKQTINRYKLAMATKRFRQNVNVLKKYAFKKLQNKLVLLDDMNNKANIANSFWLQQQSLKIWRTKTINSLQGHSVLLQKEKFFVKRKCMKRLKEIIYWKIEEAQGKTELTKVFLKYFFKNIWHKRFQERLQLYSIQATQDKKLVSKYLQRWVCFHRDSTTATAARRNHLLKSFMRVWSLHLASVQKIKDKNQQILNNNFAKWRHRNQLNRSLVEFTTNQKILRNYNMWLIKYKEIFKLHKLAVSADRNTLLRKTFILWFNKIVEVREMSSLSSIFLKLQIFERLKQNTIKKHDRMLNLIFIADHQRKSMLLTNHLKLWKRAIANKRMQLLENAVNIYKSKHQIALLRAYFFRWQNRFNLYSEDLSVKALSVREFHLCSLHLHNIMDRKQLLQQLVDVGESIRQGQCLSNTFYRWRDKLEQVYAYEIMLEEEIDRRNTLLTSQYLNKWSVKMLKNRLNSNMEDIFRTRWDRATMRGLLLLWKTRADNSPRKVRRHNSSPLSPRKLDLELVTPVKSIIRGGHTTVPASERMKQSRMDAMRSRYSRARRAIPSPIKASTSLPSAAKKKISVEDDSRPRSNSSNRSATWEEKPPPRLSLERINKSLAARKSHITFDRIPETDLGPFSNFNSTIGTAIDRTLLETGEDDQFDDSPTRRT